MHGSIKQQMNRYPVFSCNKNTQANLTKQPHIYRNSFMHPNSMISNSHMNNSKNSQSYIDQSQLFKDQQLKNKLNQHHITAYNSNNMSTNLNQISSNIITSNKSKKYTQLPYSTYTNTNAHYGSNYGNLNFSGYATYTNSNNNNINAHINMSSSHVKKNLSLFSRVDKKNQTITNIYDKIVNNNAYDPIYVHVRKEIDKQRHKQNQKDQKDKQTQMQLVCDQQQKQKEKEDYQVKKQKTNKQKKVFSTITSARNSSQKIDKSFNDFKDFKDPKKHQMINRFMGQLAQSITDNKNDISNDINRTQKISLLKRIIQHYNIKSVQRKYYSNLIKNFGIKIESINSNQIACKKSLHPRQVHSTPNNHFYKNFTNKQADTENQNQNLNQSLYQNNQQQQSNYLQTEQTVQGKAKLYQIKTSQMKPNQFHRGIIFSTDASKNKRGKNRKKVRPNNSFVYTKQHCMNNSKQSIKLDEQSTSSRMYIDTLNIQHNTNPCKLSPNIKYRSQISQKMRKSIQYSQKLVQKPIKMQASSSIQDKINKYRDFLFLINYSNGIYRDLDVQKYQKTFKYFVGFGNNGNLIKSLMKKRFWFEQTTDPLQANFIWTQIKIQDIFQKQNKLNQILPIKNLVADTYELNQNQNYQQIKKQIKRHENFLNNKQIRFGKCKTRARDYAPQDPLLKIVTLQDARAFRQILQALYYKKCPTFFDKLKLSNKELNFVAYQNHFERVHNHFPFNGLLGNKKALYYNLRQYCKLSCKKISQYVPMTFHIKKGISDEQYKSVLSLYNQRKKQKLPNYWIMKPGEYSNRGQGITCTNKIQDIRHRVNKCRQTSKAGKQSSLIVQLYISNPLLYNGRKFDIRVFMMITINNGKIKGYWYQEGYVRTSSFIWSLTQIEDKYIHLTNDAIQKTCDQYGLYEPGNKLTFNDLQRYLHTLPKSGRNMEFFQAIYPQMRNIATDAIKCACLRLDQRRLNNNFEIFGLDFMVDQNIKPWLIQVNTNPCLQLNCPILERILPHMVQNAFRIALDPLFPPPSSLNSEYKYSIPENALHYNKFQLVFDEDRDGQLLNRLYKGSNIREQLKQLNDLREDQEVFEGDGDMIQVQDQ